MITKRYKTLEEALIDIEAFNLLLGFPDEKSDTITYCNTPNLIEIKDENDNVIESYYEIPITDELDKLLNPVIEEI